MDKLTLEGNIVDVVSCEIFSGIVVIENGKILQIRRQPVDSDLFIVPGLVDAHIHIESSMLVPSEFARMAVIHGTVATVSDPHEIANVLGIDGVNFMIENGATVPLKFNFGAPSCVPATSFESSGARLGIVEVEKLLARNEIKYLSEMMNYPGVLFKDEEVMGKLKAAKKFNKPIDGHAPGLRSSEARQYVESGITTDHECFTFEEALEKISYGMKIQIREGSAAKNFETLIPLLNEHREKVMFCSDDKHPDDLINGHINRVIKRAIKLGYDPVDVLRVCSYNPVKHYNLDVGLLQSGDPADFIVVDNLEEFNVLATYIDGKKVAENGKCLFTVDATSKPNIFNAKKVTEKELEVPAIADKMRVIKALDGQLITESFMAGTKVSKNFVVSDTDRDILKLVVINRYRKSPPAIAFIHGFGLKRGAIASTVAHDSHNIIALGVRDRDLAAAINTLVDTNGGISLSDDDFHLNLPLPVAGIMSNGDGYSVARKYEQLDSAAKNLGSALKAPLMTLSFMALLVIPELKLSDKGLFNGSDFKLTNLFV